MALFQHIEELRACIDRREHAQIAAELWAAEAAWAAVASQDVV